MKTGIAILDRDVGHPLFLRSLHQKRPLAKPRWALAQSTLRILAPIDLSTDPAVPVESAIGLARTLGAHLTLLNVSDAGTSPFSWPRKVIDGSLTGVVDHWTVPGRVAETVSRFAEFVSADLLLMPERGFGKRTPFWKADVTAEVMASSGKPVLVGAGSLRYRKILCALTLDGNDDAVIREAEALARRTGGELILLGAVPDPSEALLHEVLSGSPISADVAGDRIERIARRLAVPYECLILSGSMEDCAARAALEHEADVVIVNRRELDPRRVFRKLKCPLLTVAGARPARRTVRAIVEDN